VVFFAAGRAVVFFAALVFFAAVVVFAAGRAAVFLAAEAVVFFAAVFFAAAGRFAAVLLLAELREPPPLPPLPICALRASSDTVMPVTFIS
jgi:hypothetical protein